MKKKYILLTCLALAITGGSILYSQSLNEKNAIEDNYVESQFVESPTGQSILVKNPRKIDEVANYANLIVEGEIVGINELEEEIQMGEGTIEKEVTEKTTGESTFTRRGTDYTVQVLDTIKGNLQNQEITIYRSDNAYGIHPDMKVGERYIFLLEWNENIGKYFAFHPSASYLKVDETDNIEPVYKMTKEFSDLEDQNYDKVKDTIRDIVGTK